MIGVFLHGSLESFWLRTPLPTKLHTHGLSLNACDLFGSHLCYMFERVNVKISRSTWMGCNQKWQSSWIYTWALIFLFNVFVNDIFHIMWICKLYNYANDNSLSVASWHIHDVLSYLSKDCKDCSETMEYKLIHPFIYLRVYEWAVTKTAFLMDLYLGPYFFV